MSTSAASMPLQVDINELAACKKQHDMLYIAIALLIAILIIFLWPKISAAFAVGGRLLNAQHAYVLQS